MTLKRSAIHLSLFVRFFSIFRFVLQTPAISWCRKIGIGEVESDKLSSSLGLVFISQPTFKLECDILFVEINFRFFSSPCCCRL